MDAPLIDVSGLCTDDLDALPGSALFAALRRMISRDTDEDGEAYSRFTDGPSGNGW